MSSTAKEVHAAAAKSYDTISQKHKTKETPKPFRHFNNHVKKQIIQLAIDYQRGKILGELASKNGSAGSKKTTTTTGGADESSTTKPRGVRVLDLASGRGGDMGKWVYGCSPPLGGAPQSTGSAERIVVELYHAYDISKQSVEEAENRYKFLEGNPNPNMPLFATNVHFGVSNTFNEYFYQQLCGRSTADADAVENEESSSSSRNNSNGSPVAPPPAAIDDDEATDDDKKKKESTKFVAPGTTGAAAPAEPDSMTTSIVAVEPNFYDIVSCQFAFHYGCSSYAAVSHTLGAIASVMSDEAIFIATIVDCEELSRRFVLDDGTSSIAQGHKSTKDGSDSATLGNGLFEIRFDTENINELNLIKEAEEKKHDDDAVSGSASNNNKDGFLLPFGARYHFLLEGHVDCDEYAVPMDNLIQIAASVHLEVVPEGTFKFKDQVERYSSNPKVRKQLQGESMSVAEMELVAMYRTVAFRKKPTAPSS